MAPAVHDHWLLTMIDWQRTPMETRGNNQGNRQQRTKAMTPGNDWLSAITTGSDRPITNDRLSAKTTSFLVSTLGSTDRVAH